MSGYAIDPTQPLPKRWRDNYGPMRLMTVEPVEGYVMARRAAGFPFVLSVRDLLGGKWEPILPKPKVNVREIVSKLA